MLRSATVNLWIAMASFAGFWALAHAGSAPKAYRPMLQCLRPALSLARSFDSRVEELAEMAIGRDALLPPELQQVLRRGWRAEKDGVAVRAVDSPRARRFANVVRRYLKAHRNVETELFTTEEGRLLVRVLPLRSSGLPRAQDEADWLTLKATGLERLGRPHELVFDLELARKGAKAKAYYSVHHARVSAPWVSLSPAIDWEDSQFHELMHLLSAQDVRHDVASAGRRLEDVRIPAGRRFEIALGQQGQPEAYSVLAHEGPRVEVRNLRTGERGELEASKLFEALARPSQARWLEPPKAEIFATDIFEPLKGSSYAKRFVIEESRNSLAQAEIGLIRARTRMNQLERLENFPRTEETLRKLAELRGGLRMARQEAKQVQRFHAASLPLLTSAEKALLQGARFVAAERRDLDRLLMVRGQGSLYLSSGQINWYRPRGQDHSMDPVVVSGQLRALARTIQEEGARTLEISAEIEKLMERYERLLARVSADQRMKRWVRATPLEWRLNGSEIQRFEAAFRNSNGARGRVPGEDVLAMLDELIESEAEIEVVILPRGAGAQGTKRRARILGASLGGRAGTTPRLNLRFADGLGEGTHGERIALRDLKLEIPSEVLQKRRQVQLARVRVPGPEAASNLFEIEALAQQGKRFSGKLQDSQGRIQDFDSAEIVVRGGGLVIKTEQGARQILTADLLEISRVD
jgi:hypothetical protein